MSAILAHHVDMAPDTNDAAPTGLSGVTTEPGVAAAVAVDVAVAECEDATTSISSTTSGRKEPPPERPSDTRRRTRVILSFWLIVLCLGLPVWWKTTAIPRADLPLDDMMDWADGKVSCCGTPLSFHHHPVCALTLATPGLSPSLSFTHLNPGKRAPGTGGTEPPAPGPARP